MILQPPNFFFPNCQLVIERKRVIWLGRFVSDITYLICVTGVKKVQRRKEAW